MPQSFFPDFTTGRPGEITISPWSYQSVGTPLTLFGGGAAASQNFVTANLAVFCPFWIPEQTVFYKLGWANGAAVAGNLDAGIYSEAGARLVSTGSTAQANANVMQSVTITPTTLARGSYLLGLASDTSGATQKLLSSLPAAGLLQSIGLLQMAAAFVLPANATYAKYTSAFVPLMVAQGYRTVGP
jgi:hypothetical protein